MFVGKIKKEAIKAFDEMIRDGVISGFIKKIFVEFKQGINELPPEVEKKVLGKISKYIEEIQITPGAVVFKLRKDP